MAPSHDDNPSGTNPEESITDPADEHFEQSMADFEEYDREVASHEFPFEDLVEPNHEILGDRGNPWSLQGFDLDTFRDRT